jgi:ABC-type spermidine/putrescine transport system permease subunit I
MTKMQRFYTTMGWIAVLYMVLFFLYPVLKVVITSVWVNDQFTWDNYRSIFSTSLYTHVLLKTLWISLVSTFITLLIGYALAYFIANRPVEQLGMWILIVISSMFMSLTIRLFGWMILLGDQGPIILLLNKLLGENHGIKLMFSSTAVIIGIVHFVLPFVVLNIYTTLKKIDPSLFEASTMLGASNLRTFWKVVFPLSLPGVYAGGSLAFSLSASTFLVPTVLGGPEDNLMSNVAFTSIVNIGNMGLGAALSFVLLVIIAAVLMVVSALERRGQSVS